MRQRPDVEVILEEQHGLRPRWSAGLDDHGRGRITFGLWQIDPKRRAVRLIPNAPDNILILEEERTMTDDLAFQRLGLTPRETQVLRWVAEGKSNPEIGIILGARERTVAKHLQRIHAKLGVESRTAAARFALARAPSAHQ